MTERPSHLTTSSASRAVAAPALESGAPRRWVEPALIVAFWTVMAMLTAIGQMLDPRGSRWQPVIPGASIGLAFIASYLWAALTPLIFKLSRRYALDRARWRRRLPVLLAIGVLMAMSVEAIVAFLRLEVFFEFGSGLRFNPFFGMRRLFWLDDLVVYLAVLAAGSARDYFIRMQERHDEAVRLRAHASRLQAEAAELHAQLAEARLATLRSQLDPHFLFNTLNAISSLVGSDPRGVRRMIARLSALLRYTLEESAEPEVPLAQELQVLRQYVEIMEVRFEGRLQFDTQLDPGALDALVPNLILQPLVENAIKHGVSRLPNESVGMIQLAARREGDDIVLAVRDNGPEVADADALARAGGGVGLRNTRERLAQLYGPEHTLTLAPAAGGGVVATLTLPYHTRADLHAAGSDEGPDQSAAPAVSAANARG